MALPKPGKVICSDILDAPFVHLARRNVPGRHQVPQPLRGVGVDLVPVGPGRAHARTLFRRPFRALGFRRLIFIPGSMTVMGSWVV